MGILARLLASMNRAFDKDPDAFLGLRLQYDGGMQWQILDGVLTTAVQGGSGGPLRIDLAPLSLLGLAGKLVLQPGYSVPYTADAVNQGASALRLLQTTGDIRTSNGDHFYAYTSVLYAYLDAMGQELDLARQAIAAIPDELSVTSADGEWLDFLGSYYAVRRLNGEVDGLYARRIIAETLRAKGNNVAIEMAIQDYTGQDVTIADVVIFRGPEPSFDGIPHYDGAYKFQLASVPAYGLFDCQVGYDLLGGSQPPAYIATLRGIIERLRDAGTQLRNVTLTGSSLSDRGPLPTDDLDTLVITRSQVFDGSFNFDGTRQYSGGVSTIGTIEGAADRVVKSLTSLLIVQDSSPSRVQVTLPDGSVLDVLLS